VRAFKTTLFLAGIYNVLWGAWVILLPQQFWNLMHLPIPSYMSLWQCIGMIVGVYGIGYLVAARDPLRHWPIVLVGLLGKVFGPVGFVNEAIHGRLPWRFGVMNIFNDLIWWVPFALILVAASKHRQSKI
jgi:small multidrug resistance pump